MKTALTLITLMLLLSCKKENSKRWTEITIKANNYITGEPIDDIACGVIIPKEKFFDTEYKVINEGLTQNGVYHYAFKAPKKIMWAESDYNENKYYAVDFKQTLYFDVGKKNEFQQYLVPMGYMRTIIKNINCYDLTDTLNVTLNSNIDIPNYNLHKGNFYYIGCNIDVINSYTSVPIGNYEYRYSVTRNGVTTNYIDTIEVKENKYTDLIIEY